MSSGSTATSLHTMAKIYVWTCLNKRQDVQKISLCWYSCVTKERLYVYQTRCPKHWFPWSQFSQVKNSRDWRIKMPCFGGDDMCSQHAMGSQRISRVVVTWPWNFGFSCHTLIQRMNIGTLVNCIHLDLSQAQKQCVKGHNAKLFRKTAAPNQRPYQGKRFLQPYSRSVLRFYPQQSEVTKGDNYLILRTPPQRFWSW